MSIIGPSDESKAKNLMQMASGRRRIFVSSVTFMCVRIETLFCFFSSSRNPITSYAH
jgi:hypothetical protein